jgi:hypothetical protein
MVPETINGSPGSLSEQRAVRHEPGELSESAVPLVAPAQLVSSTIPSPMSGRVNAVDEARRKKALRSMMFGWFISISLAETI